MVLSEHLTNWVRALCLLVYSLPYLVDSELFESLITQIWFISETPKLVLLQGVGIRKCLLVE